LYSVRKALNLPNTLMALGCCEAESMVYRSMLVAWCLLVSVGSYKPTPGDLFVEFEG
jgi:hypothetical protein